MLSMLSKTKAIIVSVGIFCLTLPALQGCSSKTENVGTSSQKVDPDDWKAENEEAQERIVLAREAFHDGKIVNRPPDPPFGMRSGAHSRPFASGMHWEVPQKFNCTYCGRGTLAGYESYHRRESGTYGNGFFKESPVVIHVYKGQGYLPAGSWTGEPLEPVHGQSQKLSWKRDAQGKIRTYEVSGEPLKITPAPTR